MTRLRKLKSDLTKYGGAELLDAGNEPEEGAVTEAMLEKERKATEALRGEVEQMERDRERPVHPAHSGKSGIPGHSGALHGSVVRYISPTPITVSGGTALNGTMLPANPLPVEAAFVRPPAPGLGYPASPGLVATAALPPRAPGLPPRTSFMPPAAAQASPAVLYRAPVMAGTASPMPPGMYRSVSSTVLGF